MPLVSRRKKCAAISRVSLRSTGAEMRDLKPVDLVVIGGGIDGRGHCARCRGPWILRSSSARRTISLREPPHAPASSSSGSLESRYYGFRLVLRRGADRARACCSTPRAHRGLAHALSPRPARSPSRSPPGSSGSVSSACCAWVAGGSVPGCRSIDLRRDPEGKPIRSDYTRAFEYSDCWVDDARLVALNALDAERARRDDHDPHRGNRRPPCRWCMGGGIHRGGWARHGGAGPRQASANAAGPWVGRMCSMPSRAPTAAPRAICQGQPPFGFVPKFWEGPQAYLFQHTDKRVISTPTKATWR